MKTYEVRFLQPAIADLENLFRFLAQRGSYETAQAYLDRIEDTCNSLAVFPERGTVVPGRIAGLCRMGFEHRVTILFRVAAERVEILRILYGGRQLPDL